MKHLDVTVLSLALLSSSQRVNSKWVSAGCICLPIHTLSSFHLSWSRLPLYLDMFCFRTGPCEIQGAPSRVDMWVEICPILFPKTACLSVLAIKRLMWLFLHGHGTILKSTWMRGYSTQSCDDPDIIPKFLISLFPHIPLQWDFIWNAFDPAFIVFCVLERSD